MKEKGFTLIELLAVIVILAIISLIATPIILGIINDAREESNERSVELYASAVRNAIAAYQLTGTSKPKSFDDLTVEYEGTVECTTQELYSDGSFYLAGCIVNGGTKTYNYGEQKEELAKFTDVCTPVTTATTGTVPIGAYNIGDEYTCEVKEGTSYTFFVLSKEDNKVNLIMDSNIRKDGTPVKEASPTTEQIGSVAWINSEDYVTISGTDLRNEESCKYGGMCANNEYGPVSATNYLKEATSSWTNTSSIVEMYDDEGLHFENFKITGHARMPKISEVGGTGCDITNYTSGSCPLWMTNYLTEDTTNYPNRTVVSGVSGYWILSSYDSNSNNALGIVQAGMLVPIAYVSNESPYGVRPVITLEI